MTLLVVVSLGTSPGATSAESLQGRTTGSDATHGVTAADDDATDAIATGVVKVFATVRYPDPYKPWTKEAPADVTASGIVIEGKRILTNAHVVLYASQVQVQASRAGNKLSARVEAIAPGIDLAVLKLDDESFFDSHRPLPRASTLPAIKDAVLAYGFPTGGDSLSITKGIVSRIEFSQYTALGSGLRIQVDAAVNPGNSGGAAVAGDRVIGLVFSHLGQADNIGYIVPCEEIELFLEDIADGRYDGKPAMYDELQTLENDVLRSFLKLDTSVEGIVVHAVDSPDPGYPLKEWDVIKRIGDTPIDDQGMIQLSSQVRVRFAYLIQKLAKDGRVPLTIVRGGKEMALALPVAARRPALIQDLQGAYPSYFIYGPLVFSTATVQFFQGLQAMRNNLTTSVKFITSPLLKRLLDKRAFEDEGLVVVSSPFFPHRIAKGYGNPMLSVARSVNGIPIRNLAHLVEVLRDAKDEFVVFEFDGVGNEGLAFRRAEMLTGTDEILNDNGIRSQGSADTLAIWKAGATR